MGLDGCVPSVEVLSDVLVRAGFSQTEQALVVYVQHQTSKKQEKVWIQGERSKGIWIANDITFQTTQPSKVSLLIFLHVALCGRQTKQTFWADTSETID